MLPSIIEYEHEPLSYLKVATKEFDMRQEKKRYEAGPREKRGGPVGVEGGILDNLGKFNSYSRAQREEYGEDP